MNYPIWYLPSVGGGAMIAAIAVSHVFISHFAVGGGFWLVLLETRALRHRDQPLYRFTQSFARLFVLTTLIFGALTGVGIWFAISLVQPAGTSALIHRFVFIWAAEWVLFLVEVVAITVYLHSFGHLAPRRHLIVGRVYCAASWLSLFAINGIITFMLTPGMASQHSGLPRAFFNPSFWPSLALRTCLAGLISGLFVAIFAAFLADRDLASRLIRMTAGWSLLALCGALPAGLWYLQSLPVPVRTLTEGASPTIVRTLAMGRIALWVLLPGSLLALWRPARIGKAAAMAGLAAGLLLMGSFEWTREAARRPYVLYGDIYSNGQRADRTTTEPFLPTAPWSRSSSPGRELFKFQCYACHTLGGLNNDIIERTRGMSQSSLAAYISQLHAIRPFMPPFIGTAEEQHALAAYLIDQQPTSPDTQTPLARPGSQP
ncbi:cytochrome c, 1 heme-binding site [Syntrophotalea carbinolica DSM 2380]|uniref:Cytochrome c, 1 heme-binding site n=1 Tax=Syntrophotalea carbinolica (strain DSM 2380 / NBRC 103641 / GraBd1) TaxID=338963 RepID=Q3A1E9_SYNC1|nr:cytochrome ubiquinol oxidase subunit I [Syntrophotalea carbinolica]ABA89808.1 cytochrome c, 1 heme-binding site [Syntrophotalea carbinolica DSM 2380]